MADNVNNLNGVPNFGHGFQDQVTEVPEEETIATPAEEPEEKVDTIEDITSEESE